MNRSVLLLLFIMILWTGCKQLENEDAKISKIQDYVEEVKETYPSYDFKRSMMFSLGDYTFSATSFFDKDNKLKLVEEVGNMGEYGNLKKRYFLKDDQLVFVGTDKRFYQGNHYIYSEEKAFLSDEGDEVLMVQKKEAPSLIDLQEQDFQTITSKTDYSGELSRCLNAIEQRQEFAPQFKKVWSLRGKSFLQLGEAHEGTFEADLRIRTKDSLILMLESSPQMKGVLLDIDWEYQHTNGYEEMVYKGGQVAAPDEANKD
ncbi:hypothetical protein V6R21_13165 [Limibacter armeniacum]|uniref:hypothetical protein n=1 Tax=Limibacter armeniacum TaxID=466084 RepID=UPI002FE6B894